MSYSLLAFIDPTVRATEHQNLGGWQISADDATRSRIRNANRFKAEATAVNQPLLTEVLQTTIREHFIGLATQWTNETGAHSSLSKRKMHPAYRRIVDLGHPAVPLLLNALREIPDFWFPALRDITGENPVLPEDRGDFDRMAEAWLKWGRDRGLIQ